MKTWSLHKFLQWSHFPFPFECTGAVFTCEHIKREQNGAPVLPHLVWECRHVNEPLVFPHSYVSVDDDIEAVSMEE